MGRPSVADERREQIAAAVVRCILKHGVSGATRARIAAEAGMAPSAVHHFAGTQAQVVQSGVDQAAAQVGEELAARVVGDTPEARLEAALDALFGGGFVASELNQLVDELVAHAYRSTGTRDALRELYAGFQGYLERLLEEAHPTTPPEARHQTALSLLVLAHASATFQWLGIDEHAMRKQRHTAERLLEDLR